MRIAGASLRSVDVPLTRPYAVANHATDTASMLLLRLATDGGGVSGVGAATPEPEVNGDTRDEAVRQLHGVLDRLRGREVAPPGAFADVLALLQSPGARMALDIALHDLWGRVAGVPLVDLLGRVHTAMPTSVTIGIGDVAATLRDADEYVARGFTVLKVKIGQDLDLDVERLVRLRERVGRGVALRVDGNVGYRPPQLLALLRATQALDLEFVEQPLPRDAVAAQRVLPTALVAQLMADESLHDEADARALLAPPRPFGSFNLKLVKCGGIAPARAIAALAHDAGLGVMWGCMDESRIAIAAALHAAFSCAATRWLDLDGHLDLASDVASGGFTLVDGVMRYGGTRMIIESYVVEEFDCLIHVTHYEPYIPAFTSGPPEDCYPPEWGCVEWEVLNLLGERDMDLESRITDADRDRINQLIVEQMEHADEF